MDNNGENMNFSATLDANDNTKAVRVMETLEALSEANHFLQEYVPYYRDQHHPHLGGTAR